MTKLSRGYDIKLLGKAQDSLLDVNQPRLYALKPTDVHGIGPIPKLTVEIGSEVLAGDPLFFDKANPGVQFCSPVSGEVVEVRRGARRAITEVVILADSQIEFRKHDVPSVESASREDLVKTMCDAGAWVLIKQRPFNVLADPDVIPRDIFVSCMDTAPLAADQNKVIEGREAAFQKGLDVLARLTAGSLHLGVGPGAADVYTKASGVNVHAFSGPHPAGNVGVQIHHIKAINKGDTVWTLDPQDVAIIGKLFTEGVFDAERVVAVAGDELNTTGYWRTRIGASIAPVVDSNTKQDNVRCISGDVLSGTRIAKDGFLGLYSDLITVVEEGNKMEMFGWLLPSYKRPSRSRTFLSFLRPNKEYHVNTNNHGDERAYVVTGQYDAVVPMDVLPVYLVKSILYQDFEQMEGLGIYEVVEEDLALCEFVCTSKQPVQQILRSGLDFVRLEG
ncbi:MAG: Na(+)-translocating NADH-quinone reductase subunit A [Rhodothermales bacterium]